MSNHKFYVLIVKREEKMNVSLFSSKEQAFEKIKKEIHDSINWYVDEKTHEILEKDYEDVCNTMVKELSVYRTWFDSDEAKVYLIYEVDNFDFSLAI